MEDFWQGENLPEQIAIPNQARRFQGFYGKGWVCDQICDYFLTRFRFILWPGYHEEIKRYLHDERRWYGNGASKIHIPRAECPDLSLKLSNRMYLISTIWPHLGFWTPWKWTSVEPRGQTIGGWLSVFSTCWKFSRMLVRPGLYVDWPNSVTRPWPLRYQYHLRSPLLRWGSIVQDWYRDLRRTDRSARRIPQAN